MQVPHLTENKLIYVNAEAGNDANDGSKSAPFATVQAAINSIPKDLGGKSATINITGDIADSDNIGIGGFYAGSINLKGDPEGTICHVKLNLLYCSYLSISGITFEAGTGDEYIISVAECDKVGINACTLNGTGKTTDGIRCSSQSNLGVSTCTFNNLKNAIDTSSSSSSRGAAMVSVYDCDGEGNAVAVYCSSSAICVEMWKPLEDIGADTTVLKRNGGIVFRENGTLYTG